MTAVLPAELVPPALLATQDGLGQLRQRDAGDETDAEAGRSVAAIVAAAVVAVGY